jgi:arylsulfatase
MSKRVNRLLIISILSVGIASSSAAAQQAGGTVASQQRPNIVLMFPDNLGFGEVGSYGGVRDVPTPRIDRIGAEGIRLTNFNTEYSCTVSRIAMLTGRYAVRSGGSQGSGMTLWEVTIPEILKPLGYGTGIFGKYHVGGDNWLDRGRDPMAQGFDEWFGIPGTSHTAQFTSLPTWNPADEPPYIWEGRAGEVAKKVKVYDLDTRRTIDRESAERGIGFMERSVAANRPFFALIAFTHLHFPALPHPDFAGKTGAGDMGDAMADLDYNTGLVLDAIKQLGIEGNTMVLWCTDGGGEARRPWRGSNGPWSGYYNGVLEGGIRSPCMIRWPGRIPAGRVSNEIVHEIDFLPTFAAAAGATTPQDRAIDGVNQLPFLEGKQEKSNRESVLYYAGNALRAVKWRDWKFHYQYQNNEGNGGGPPGTPMRLFNLRTDPREESDVKDFNPWAISVMDKLVADFLATTQRYPHVPPNAPDPYVPPPRGPTSSYR